MRKGFDYVGVATVTGLSNVEMNMENGIVEVEGWNLVYR
jgi:hypothetical protein